MLFDTNTNGDLRSFMHYKGDYYINGTEIKLTDEYISKHQFNGKPLWKYARFDHQTTYNGRLSYFFCRSRADWLTMNPMGLDVKDADNYAPYFVVVAYDLESAIDEIVKPIKLGSGETQAIQAAILNPKRKRDIDEPGMIILWALYIFAMIGSLIFNQFYLIWIVATILFIKWRSEMLR